MKMLCIRWEEHCTNICVLAKAIAISTKILPCVTVQLQIPKMFSAEYDQVPYSKGYPAHTEDVSLEDRGPSGSWKTSIKCQSALKRNSLFWKINREHFESHIQNRTVSSKFFEWIWGDSIDLWIHLGRQWGTIADIILRSKDYQQQVVRKTYTT